MATERRRKLSAKEMADKLKNINTPLPEVKRPTYEQSKQRIASIPRRKEWGDIYGEPKFYRYGEGGNNKKKRNPEGHFMTGD